MHLRVQLASLCRFRQRARLIVDDGVGGPLFAVGSATLAFDPSTHQFRRVVSCHRCSELVESSGPVHRRAAVVAGEQLVVCRDCAQVPLDGGSWDPSADLDVLSPRHHGVVPVEGRVIVRVEDRERSVQATVVPRPGGGHLAAAVNELQARAEQVLAEAEDKVSPLRGEADRTLEAAGAERLQAAATLAEAESTVQGARALADAVLTEAEEKASSIRADADDYAALVRKTVDDERSRARTILEAAVRGRRAIDHDRAQAAAVLADAEKRASELQAQVEAGAGRIRERGSAKSFENRSREQAP